LKKILIAGGLCGTTMLMAAEKIQEECFKNQIDVAVKIHNLWESAYVDTNNDIVIEMFPFFKDLRCPVLSGKPFICKREEDKLIHKIISILKGE
jgi:galactitol-specific phosphotransferase system IIB component